MAKSSTTVDSIRHNETRKNIPTHELRDFVTDEETAPKAMLYPRDPSLDPQLVWKGKDEQDASDLSVPVVPIYIQEKIHPQYLIDDLLQSQHSTEDGAKLFQGDMFSSFDGIEEFERKVDFYHHDQHWSNRMILGDSLLVMTSLAEKEGLKGKVQTIYFDPPYGIKFGSNWQVSTRKREVKDGKAEDATRQPEQVRAFRDTWKLGIHSYLAYLRDRLIAARELLTETGSVFVQIGDENVHLVRCLLDEIFGNENFITQISFAKTSATGEEKLGSVCDYLLWYGKQKESLKYRTHFLEKRPGGRGGSGYTRVLLPNDDEKPLGGDELSDLSSLPNGSRLFTAGDISSQRPAQGNDLRNFSYLGKSYTPGSGTFKTDKKGLERLAKAGRLISTSGNRLAYRRFLDDFPVFELNNLWADTLGQNQFGGDKVYVVQTANTVAQRCILMTSDPGDLVLDPTCGSGTTAYVAEQWGRRWITIDTSRVALALTRTRLMSARYPYYLLADSPEGSAKEAELSSSVSFNSLDTKHPDRYEYDVRKGFVYRRVPHVTLKAIANNAEIDVIHEKFQAELETLREEINRLVGQNWQEWEIPRELTEKQSKISNLQTVLQRYWELRRQRQQCIDDSIARNADTETLYDQPYDDNKRVRVSGPFTVESLSPHRMLSTNDDDLDGTVSEQEVKHGQDFASMIIDNLKSAGVQNTKKNERLKFDRLESYAGEWLHAAGEYSESDGSIKRVAVSIGPEHGTVAPDQVQNAAREAVRGLGFDLLIVCGFAFDSHVNEEAKRYGKLTVLPVRMNPDLAMSDELLKKTGAGNLFMIFGEPDINIIKKDGKVTVEILGVDVYDPTTGAIRSSSIDDIACWFIDTDYNDESFFVRHAYFTGAGEPYDKLKRALRAEIDEGAWSALYSTVSRPFDTPASGKIAVKVINHYGDEVLKVYKV